MLRWAHGDDVPPGHRPAGPLFRRWYDAYVDVLARAHGGMALEVVEGAEEDGFA